MKTTVSIIVSVIIVCIAVLAFKAPSKNPNWQYCTLVGTANLFGTKVKVNVDYGQEGGRWDIKANKLKDEEGKIIKFNSMVDALNYMTEQGWEYVDAYPISIGNSAVYNFLLRKPIEP